jgi:Cd2+/Zn2+-exporting ATPase
MDCAEEVSLLRNRLSRVDGVGELSFDIFQAKMGVEYDAGQVRPEAIAEAVAETGMRAEVWSAAPPAETFWQRRGKTVLTTISGLCLLAALIWQGLHTGHLIESLLAHNHHDHAKMLKPILGLIWIAIITGLWPSLPKAWLAIKQFRPDMNALVVLSVIGASFLGEWAEAGTLSFLFGLAGLLESWSLSRARDAISGLLKVAPQEATLIHEKAHDDDCKGHEHEHRVPVERVNVGSTIRIKPGERVPCDGEVLRGVSSMSQALISGEPMPVEKRAGDMVYAGAINEDGTVEVRTTRAAADTTLARMVRMVEQSQSRRAPSEMFVERFSRVYTPLVFLLAFSVAVLPPLLGRGTWSDWFYEGLAILLISCPCALVISTPVSIIAALTSAARHGVLIKGGTFLEEAAKIRAIAFDKTGVLTRGEPEVQTLIPVNGQSAEETLRRLTALELSSEHPLARAILRYSDAQGVAVAASPGFKSLQGRGAEARVDGKNFWVGSLRLLREKNLDTPALEAGLDRLADAEHTVVACGTDESAWALLGITDPPRAGARKTLEGLREVGVERIVMLTGDNAVTARSVARAVGVDEVHSEMLPEDKAARVRELKSTFGHVAMVGDGVNDAQALAEASLGIGVGHRGSDIALETADVVLMSGELNRLPFLITHARRTVGVIQQNVALALVMKAVFLAAAFAGVATLWMAVAVDMGATFLVTFNGLRLLSSKPDR